MDLTELSDDELFDRASEAEDLCHYQEALKYWQILATRKPHAYIFKRCGVSAMKLGRLKLARDYFQQSLEKKKHASTYTLLGFMEAQLGNEEVARNHFRKALEKFPNYLELYFNLAMTYEDEPFKAIEIFQKAIAIDPDYGIAHRELGRMLAIMNELADAELHINRALELDSRDLMAYIYLGNIHWQRREPGKAEEMYQKAIELWPKSKIARRCLALLYIEEDRLSEAESLYKQSVDLEPNDAQANFHYGRFLSRIDSKAAAKIYLTRALELVKDLEETEEFQERIKAELDELDED
jgi:superkiller protein 3